MEKKYLQELDHFEIFVGTDELMQWVKTVRNNEQIESSVAGYLIGKARAVFADVKCQICSEKIIDGEEHDWRNSYGDFLKSYHHMHEACYQKAKEEKEKNISA